MASLFPTYLYQRNAIWWYRQRVITQGINTTLRVSLRTTDKHSARNLANLIASYLYGRRRPRTTSFVTGFSNSTPHKIATFRGPQELLHTAEGMLSPEEIQARSICEESPMASEYNVILSTTRKIISYYHQLELADWQSQVRTEDEYIHWLDQLHQFKSLTTEAAYLNDLRQSKNIVSDYFADTQQSLPNQDYLNLIIRKVCDSIPEVYQALLERRPPTAQEASTASPQVLASAPHQGTEPASNEKPLAEAIAAYLTENQRKGWKARTVNQYQHSLVVAYSFFGEVSIGSLTREHGRSLREILPKLIKGKTQDDLNKQGIAGCITNDIHLQISSVTANNHMNRLREFFRWSESMGYISRNPLPDDNIPAPKVSKQAKRDPITDDQAKLIFGHSLFSEHKGTKTKKIQHASHFWLPLIAAYSGMRLGEISQLSVQNIRKIGEHWCFIVEQFTENQYLKTPNAVRAVPIHNELIRIGFIEFVNYIRANNGTRLFNNIRLIQGNYSNKPSEWFIKQFRDALGLPLHVTPHAFRHSVKDKLSRVEANPENISRLLGHAGGQYGGLVSDDVSHLVPLISAIDYGAATAHIQPISPDVFHCSPLILINEVEA